MDGFCGEIGEQKKKLEILLVLIIGLCLAEFEAEILHVEKCFLMYTKLSEASLSHIVRRLLLIGFFSPHLHLAVPFTSMQQFTVL